MQNKYVILKSPVKIGDCERVASYAGSLTKGEEQLLITRDLKFFLTDGKGGYLEFKTINSGITLGEVTQKLSDLNSNLNQKIDDLDKKSNGEIISLQDAVNALNLKFNSYVTADDFNNLKKQVESNTTLATHTNRDTLDKLSEDISGNPLFNGKKIVEDVEAKISDLDNRSVIGSKLKNGLFKVTNNITPENIIPNTQIVLDTKISGDFILNADNTITLPRGSLYRVRTALRYSAASSHGYIVYCIHDFTNSKNVGIAGTINSYEDWDGQQEALAYIDTTKEEIKIGVYNIATVNPNEITATFSFLEIQEINKNTILDPCEDGKNIQFEHGLFTNTIVQNITSETLLKMNTVFGGNMSLSSNGYVKLNAGKTYKIKAITGTSKQYVDVLLWNVTDSCGIGLSGNNNSTVAAQPMGIAEIKPNKDIEITIQTRYVDEDTTINGWDCFIDVEEITQPYYFNYYKDSIKATTIFEGTAEDKTSIFTLNDSVNNYEKLIIHSCCLIDSVKREKASITINVKDIVFESSDYEFLIGGFATDSFNYFIEMGFKSEKTFKIGNLQSIGWTNPMIYKIEGIGYSYDNPYKDIITTIDDTIIKDIQADSDINDIWNEVK